MGTMPVLSSAGQSSPVPWFRSPAGAALLDSQAGVVAGALAACPGQCWLWCAPAFPPVEGPAGGRGLRLAPAGPGTWKGDIACGQPLPLPGATFATVILQHVLRAGAPDSEALLEEAARILQPGGRLWLFALNPLSPYRWRWRGAGLSASEPLAWRRRLRAHGLVPEPVSQGVGPSWRVQVDASLQHGPGLRAAYLLRAEKREIPLTPVRQPAVVPVPQGVPVA